MIKRPVPVAAVAVPARSHRVENGRGDVERLDDAGAVGATRAAAGAHRGGTTAQRSDRILRSTDVERHRGRNESGVHPREPGQGAFGVEYAGEVLQHSTECPAVGSSFRGPDDEVERGGFRVGRRHANDGRHAPKLTR